METSDGTSALAREGPPARKQEAADLPSVPLAAQPSADVARPPAAPTVIYVFANTGHHFEFVPLTSGQLQEYPELKAKCKNTDFPWREARDEQGRPLRWLRYQFACREVKADGGLEEKNGVLICLETNLGSASRGWVLQPEEKVSVTEARQYTVADKARTPYVFLDAAHQPIGEGVPQTVFLPLDADAPIGSLAGSRCVSVPLEIHWLQPAGKPVDVDLVIDFGNTRSIALLLEHNQAARGALSDICRPVRFVARSVEPELGPRQRNDPFALVDSWLILREPTFANLEPLGQSLAPQVVQPTEDLRWEDVLEGPWPFRRIVERVTGRTLRVPHMFVDISPAMLGPEASCILGAMSPDQVSAGGNMFISSPKRYLWDQTPVGWLGIAGLPFWTMAVQRWHPNAGMLRGGRMIEKLSGTICYFLDEDGTDWALGKDGRGSAPSERPDAAARPAACPNEPAYPRADALTWAALTVLESAYRQLQSAAGRPASQQFIPARLASVVVTFPPGWTAHELWAYRQKWQKAVDIFALTRLTDRRLVTDGGDRPNLSMDLDEAVAAQLPQVFDEIRRLNEEGGNWLELVGRGRGAEARARILNLDIGGGTTDITVVEYEDRDPGPGVDLLATVLYRDSSTIAGDALVQKIIEWVLLPALGSWMKPEDRRQFTTLLGQQKGAEKARWNRIARQVFVPVVNGWLADAAEEAVSDKPYARPADIPVLKSAVEEFNSLCQASRVKVLDETAVLTYDRRLVAECIRENFAGLFRSLGKVVEAFNCDLVFVSGKPSELGALRELLCTEIPLLPQRIVFSKDAGIGDWYPLTVDGRINDAKTVTVAGATLYQAIRRGLMGPGWQITRRVSPCLLTRNYWGTLLKGNKPRFGTVLLEPSEDQEQCQLQIDDRIGRRMLPSDTRPEPVYQLKWLDRSRYLVGTVPVNARLSITLGRVLPPQDQTEGAADQALTPEGLEIVEVKGEWNGKPVAKEDVQLALCTLETDAHWLDAGTFQIVWPSP